MPRNKLPIALFVVVLELHCIYTRMDGRICGGNQQSPRGTQRLQHRRGPSRHRIYTTQVPLLKKTQVPNNPVYDSGSLGLTRYKLR
jgi:hypothetical protein